jgi:hypothetical protein
MYTFCPDVHNIGCVPKNFTGLLAALILVRPFQLAGTELPDICAGQVAFASI